MNEFGEPWTLGSGGYEVVSAHGDKAFQFDDRIGWIYMETPERVVACVNACRCIPTEVLGPVMDRLFTAMMSAKAVYESSSVGYVTANHDLLATAKLLEGAGVDLTELLKQCRLEKP